MQVPGQAPMTGPQMGNFANAMTQVSPPKNKQIPYARIDPQHVWLTRLHAVRHALTKLDESIDDQDDLTQTLVSQTGEIIERIMKGMPPDDIAFSAGIGLLRPVSPQAAQIASAEWAQKNRAASVPAAPGAIGPPPGGAPGMGPGAIPPGQNPGVLAAMAQMAGGGGAPGMAGSPPPGPPG